MVSYRPKSLFRCAASASTTFWFCRRSSDHPDPLYFLLFKLSRSLATHLVPSKSSPHFCFLVAPGYLFLRVSWIGRILPLSSHQNLPFHSGTSCNTFP